MSETLKPCPFCGGEAARVDNGPTAAQLANGLSWGQDFDDGGSFIHCTRCDASSAIHFDRKENLYSSWNDRIDGISAERSAIAAKAREWAAHYDQGSDGRNTFVLFAEWVEDRAASQPSPRVEGGEK